MTEMVNINGELDVNEDKWMMEKIRSGPHTITIPPSKTCTTGARSDSLWVSIIEDDTTTGVLGEGTIRDDVSWVIAEGTKAVWTVVRGVAKAMTKRTVVSGATILGVTQGALTAIGTFILWAVNTKMPRKVTVKTMSLINHLGFWAQTGILRCNSSGVRCGLALMKGRTRVSGGIQQSSGGR